MSAYFFIYHINYNTEEIFTCMQPQERNRGDLEKNMYINMQTNTKRRCIEVED